MAFVRRYARELTLLLVCVALGASTFALLTVAGDESAACKIQAQGLPAGHALASVIADLHFFVARPLTAQQRRNLAALPAVDRKAVLDHFADLTKSAFNYAWYENQQPKSRSCAS